MLLQRMLRIYLVTTRHRPAWRGKALLFLLAGLFLTPGVYTVAASTEEPGNEPHSAYEDGLPAGESPVKLLGFVRRLGDNLQTWGADGKPVDLSLPGESELPEGTTVAVFRVPSGHRNMGYFLNGSQMLKFPKTWTSETDGSIMFAQVDHPPDRRFGNLKVTTSTATREHLFDLNSDQAQQTVNVDQFGVRKFSGLMAMDDESFQVTVIHSDGLYDSRFAAVAKDGTLVSGKSKYHDGDELRTTTMAFPIPLKELVGIALVANTFETVHFTNVAMQPNVPATPQTSLLRRRSLPQSPPDTAPPDACRLALANGVVVDLLAVGRFEDGKVEWWSPNGKEPVSVDGVFEADVEGYGTVIAARIYGAESWSVRQEVDGMARRIQQTSFSHPSYVWLAELDDTKQRTTGNVTLSIDGGEPKTIQRIGIDKNGKAKISPEGPQIVTEISAVESIGQNECRVRLRYTPRQSIELAAEDTSGTIVRRTAGSFGGGSAALTIPIAQEKLKALVVQQQSRVDATFADISLQPGRVTTVKMSQTPSSQDSAPGAAMRGAPKLPPAAPKRVFVTGTVVDEDTGAPITDYVLIPGYSHSGGNRFFDRQKAVHFDASAFLFEVVPPNFAGATKVVQELRIEAKGYPADIVELDTSKQPVTVNIKLSRDAGTPGFVLDSEGSPLTDAKIVVCLTSRWTQINDNNVRPHDPNLVVLDPDSKGMFIVSDVDQAHCVLAFHDLGYGFIELGDLAASKKVIVKPWASLSGTFRAGNKPAQGVTVQLEFMPKSAAAAPNGDVLVRYETETDADGRYSFERIPAWPGTIGKRLILERSQSGFTSTYQPSKHLIIEPGKDNVFDIGGTGRAITGRLVAPKAYRHDIDFSRTRGNLWLQQQKNVGPGGVSHYQREAWYYQRILANDPKIRDHWLRHHQTGFLVGSDGTFRVDDLPPGEYQLMCRVQRPEDRGGILTRSRNLAVYSSGIRITDSETSEPQELGDLELTIVDDSR